jgi:hypothetical protein
VQPYRVVTLENERLRVDVAPKLGGRVIRIFDKRRSKELLFQPDPSAKQYPNLSGVTVAPFADYVSRAPWPATWDVEQGRPAGEVLLVGACDNGLKMRRTLWLEDGFLRTRTVLENSGAERIEAVLQSRWDVDPGSLETVLVSYRSQGGARVDKQLIRPERQPSDSEVLTGGDQPEGEWSVSSAGTEVSLVSRFARDMVARCSLNWTAKSENRVGLAVSSHRRILGPGDRLSLDADYGVL